MALPACGFHHCKGGCAPTARHDLKCPFVTKSLLKILLASLSLAICMSTAQAQEDVFAKTERLEEFFQGYAASGEGLADRVGQLETRVFGHQNTGSLGDRLSLLQQEMQKRQTVQSVPSTEPGGTAFQAAPKGANNAQLQQSGMPAPDGAPLPKQSPGAAGGVLHLLGEISLHAPQTILAPPRLSTKYAPNKTKETPTQSAAELYQQGMDALDNHKYDDAVKALTLASELQPDSANIFMALGQAHTANDDAYGANTDYWIAHCLDRNSTAAKAQSLLFQGTIETQVKKNGGSYWVDDCHPADQPFENMLTQGVRMFAIGDLRDAQRLFEEVARLDPKNEDAYYNLGAMFETERNYPLARQFYLRAHALSPLDSQVNDALNSLGAQAASYQGGVFQAAPLTGQATQETCPICRIARGKMAIGL